MTAPLSIFMHPRCFWERRISGVARYVCELSRELFLMGHDVHIPIKDTPTDYLLNASYYGQTSAETPELPWHLRQLYRWGSKTSKAAHVRRFVRRWEGVHAMDRIPFDIVHPTHNNSTELLKHLHGKPLVVTVHDMTHELRPDSFPSNDPSAMRKKLMVEQADRVIAISQQTKDDLVRLCGTDPAKIDVIHHGNSLIMPEQPELVNIDLPERYVLFVGQREKYKNFARLVHAMCPLMQKEPDLQLLCAGGGAFRDDEMTLIADLGLAGRVRQMWVSDDELAIMYNRAICFVYPSEYEGFGLPILEAFACSCPVLCARASCFPEIAGEGAVYFDSHDTEEMTHLIQKMIEDSSHRQHYIQCGEVRLRDFSWRRCAEETLACYHKAIHS